MSHVDICGLAPRESCPHTACYCEENVWKLCEVVQGKDSELLKYCYAVFISNPSRTVPICQQRSGRSSDGLVVWDYHVIFVCHAAGKQAVVYDLDSRMSFPCDFGAYCRAAFGLEVPDPSYARLFRVVPAGSYLATFASDRRHMRNPSHPGGWNSPPPRYEPIKTDQDVDNVQGFISMASEQPSAVAQSTVCSLPGFVARFSTPAAHVSGAKS